MQKTRLLISVCATAALLACSASAAVPEKVVVQGRLANGGGPIPDGAYNVTVSLFQAAEGGEPLWTEALYEVAVSDGVFSAVLGNTSAVSPDLLSAPSALWVQMSVAGEPPLPRTQVFAQPYAVVAARALDLACAGCVSPEETTFLGDCETGEVLLKTETGWGCGEVAPPAPPVAGVPTGTIVAFAGASAPEGWALCDGGALSRTDEATLFAVTGTTWGEGDGSSTFNVPDLRGRVTVGAGEGPGLTPRTTADVGGAESTTLSGAQLPPHSHTVDPPSAGTSSAGAHSHVHTGFSDNFPLSIVHNSNGASGYQRRYNMVTQSAGNHSHSVNIGPFDSGQTGGGEPIGLIPPFAAVGYIIKL